MPGPLPAGSEADELAGRGIGLPVTVLVRAQGEGQRVLVYGLSTTTSSDSSAPRRTV
ncbi:MAG: hypothetical protein QOH46_2858 [Solirubrobacteraceae bacterium]|nr:hypothetical protein [Solirubrobacteraceae bacterium]